MKRLFQDGDSHTLCAEKNPIQKEWAINDRDLVVHMKNALRDMFEAFGPCLLLDTNELTAPNREQIDRYQVCFSNPKKVTG